MIGCVFLTKKSQKNFDKTLQNHFILGTSRTSQQDMEFSIHQMVEIASRALSPGINDPYTAISCIHNLSSTLSYLCTVELPSPLRFDEEKKSGASDNN